MDHDIPVYLVKHIGGQEFWTFLNPEYLGTSKPPKGAKRPEERVLETTTIGELIQKALSDRLGMVSGVDVNAIELMYELLSGDII